MKSISVPAAISILLVFVTSAGGSEPEKSIPLIGTGVVVLDTARAENRAKLAKILGTTVYKQSVNTEHFSRKGDVVVLSPQKVGESKPSEIAATVRELRDELCKALGTGDEFKFLMAWDASAKVWGIGFEGSTGIEVTIKCAKK